MLNGQLTEYEEGVSVCHLRGEGGHLAGVGARGVEAGGRHPHHLRHLVHPLAAVGQGVPRLHPRPGAARGLRLVTTAL